jgi:hypothetical protein
MCCLLFFKGTPARPAVLKTLSENLKKWAESSSGF